MPATDARDVDGLLLGWIRARASADGVDWLVTTSAAIADGSVDPRVAFPAVSRRVGRVALGAGRDSAAALTAELGGAPIAVPVAAWRVDDAARVLLLRAAARRAPPAEDALALAAELYFSGDPRERIAALRALAFLPAGDAGLPAVLDAVRVNQGELFEAAICENPYASTHLPDLEFRKAVLKAVFIGMSLARVARIDERADAPLAQSLFDLIIEREAAGRAVPHESFAVIARHPPPGLAAKLLGYLEHPDPTLRAAAAAGLAVLVRAGDGRLRSFLEDRAGREPVPAVRDALARALS